MKKLLFIKLIISIWITGQILNCSNLQKEEQINVDSSSYNERLIQSVVDEIKDEFTEANPIIDEVSLLDICQKNQEYDYYIVLAHGIRADRQYSGILEDELFGLFIVNRSFTEVISILDIIPTPRWNDYTMRFDKTVSDSVILIGEGLSYGDEKLRIAYPWP